MLPLRPPWLFSVNIFDPHHGFDPPDDYLARYTKALGAHPHPNYLPGELDDKPQFQRIDHNGAYNNPNLFPYSKMTDHDHRAIRATYWAMVDLIDAQIGRLLAALKESGQEENTIVIFMSDHGELLGEHGVYLKGPHFCDCVIRVPLLIAWPGTIAPGRRTTAMVELVDIAPTLLDATDLPHHPSMQGRSLWPLLMDQSNLHAHRDDVYTEYYNANLPHDPKAYATMVRTKDWILVAVHGLDDQGELYDLQNDPHERHNLWHNPEYTHVQAKLLKRLSDRMAFTIDPLPERHASQVVWW
jgi:arylsulfatase A-like enzyme